LSVDAYLAHQDERWRAVMERLRSHCLALLSEHDEAIVYRMPSYLRDGRVEIAFAKQARYLSLYVAKRGVLDAHRAKLADRSLGKGCVRYTRPEQLDFELIDALLRETAASDEEPC
jgi:uncharacterized protein YdhG (YjbR/CyaY superfamily)